MTASRRIPQVGDTARIGDTLALSIEPGERYARITGILHTWEGIGPFIIRTFRHGDSWYPTGDYRRTSRFGITPILGPGTNAEYETRP